MKKSNRKRAFAALEYMALLVFIMAAFFVFRPYIIKGFGGYWKKAGDTFGQERQYDPRWYGLHGEFGGTLECVRYLNAFYDAKCIDACATDVCRAACTRPEDCQD